jgi:hypothetical protein
MPRPGRVGKRLNGLNSLELARAFAHATAQRIKAALSVKTGPERR